MAKIFLDTNIILDEMTHRRSIDKKIFDNHVLFISTLSIHVIAYISKYKIPHQELLTITKIFNLLSFNSLVTQKALLGPTDDFEDNVQLHSAAQEDCDIFLTQDKKLLSMRFFGKMRILPTL